MDQNQDKLISEIEAAKLLGVSRLTLLLERQAGRIQFYQIRRRVLFSRAHLDAYLKSIEQPIREPRRRAA